MAVRRSSRAYIGGKYYEDIYKSSISNPDAFWTNVSKLVHWSKPFKKVCDNSNEPFTKWFVGGEINACYNALDRHVNSGKGFKTALIYDSPLIDKVQMITYAQLLEKVSKLAGALAKLGVKKGDRVLIYMPLIPETVMAMLATARLGAVHSVVFGGFGAGELCSRIEHAEPKVLIAASCGLEPNKIVRYMDILDEALSLSKFKPSKCVIFQRKEIEMVYTDPTRDVDWDQIIEAAAPFPCVPVESSDPLYVLYTSGTTGDPKGVQRPTGGHLAMLAFTMDSLYGMNSNDVWWTTSDFGWVVGHSYMCYAPLLFGVTNIIYEGKPTSTPDSKQYFRIINDYKVNAVFTIPTVMRVLKQEDPDGIGCSEFDIGSLRKIWFAGEHCDLPTKQWTEKIFKVSVSNHWWQTETGSAITAPCAGVINPCEMTDFTCGLPFPGYQIEVLKKDGHRADVNELGRIVVKLPLPPGCLSTLYKASSRFVETYFIKYPGYYDTMDAGYIDENNLVYVTARDDDIINVAGHRLSTLALENIILSHPDICNACVVSAPDDIKNEVPLCVFVIKKDTVSSESEITRQLIIMVREIMGPVGSFKYAFAVKGLPTTRSGKICRKSISDLARNKLEKIPSTVVDHTVYDDIRYGLRGLGFYND